jgi:glutamine amidotransferase
MPLNISITDYGVGNLYSIRRSLESCGANVKVIDNMAELRDAECIVFPGVGAFDATMTKLLPMREEVCDMLRGGMPALGICIGMQILFEGSDEGRSPGLGLYEGRVEKLPCRMIPHMGWNQVVSDDPLLDGVPDDNFYFVHSYYGNPKEDGITLGHTEYEGREFPSFFRKFNTYGTQFHPEKSSASGRKVLQNFISFAEGLL